MDPEQTALERQDEDATARLSVDSGEDTRPIGRSQETLPDQAAFPPLMDQERYEVLGFLGEGGMGRVFKVFDRRLGRQVALKFLRGLFDEQIERFMQEARAQARINHPHVARIYEVGDVNGIPFLSMQLIHGPTLKDAAPILNLREKLILVRQAAEALHAAHRMGIVHRDVKPQNIMLERGEDGEWAAFVMDFGLAREMEGKGVTHTGFLMGSPAYMSPEQVKGDSRKVGIETDIYSLGVTLYELLGESLPFEGKSNIELLRKVAETDPPLLRKVNPALPRELETLVHACLDKDPALRYPSARALGEDIQRYLEDVPIQAKPPSSVTMLRKWIRRNRRLSAALISIFVLALGFGAYASASTLNRLRMEGLLARTSEEKNQLAARLAALQGGLARLQEYEELLNKLRNEKLQRLQHPESLSNAERQLLARELQELEARQAQAGASRQALQQQLPGNPAPRAVLPETPAETKVETLPAPSTIVPAPQLKASQPKPEAPPARPSPTGPGVETPAEVIQQVVPRTPPMASRMPRIRGTRQTVRLQVYVDERGNPLTVKVAEAPEGTGLADAAIEAAKASTYKAATRNGQPIKGWINLNFTFVIPKR